MPKFFVGPLALVIAGLLVIAIAQTTSPGTTERQFVADLPRLGAGFQASLAISGPAAKRSGTTGSDETAERPLRTPRKFPASRVAERSAS